MGNSFVFGIFSVWLVADLGSRGTLVHVAKSSTVSELLMLVMGFAFASISWLQSLDRCSGRFLFMYMYKLETGL